MTKNPDFPRAARRVLDEWTNPTPTRGEDGQQDENLRAQLPAGGYWRSVYGLSHELHDALAALTWYDGDDGVTDVDRANDALDRIRSVWGRTAWNEVLEPLLRLWPELFLTLVDVATGSGAQERVGGVSTHRDDIQRHHPAPVPDPTFAPGSARRVQGAPVVASQGMAPWGPETIVATIAIDAEVLGEDAPDPSGQLAWLAALAVAELEEASRAAAERGGRVDWSTLHVRVAHNDKSRAPVMAATVEVLA